MVCIWVDLLHILIQRLSTMRGGDLARFVDCLMPNSSHWKVSRYMYKQSYSCINNVLIYVGLQHSLRTHFWPFVFWPLMI